MAVDNTITLRNCKGTDCKYYTPGFPIGFDIIRQKRGVEFIYEEKDSRLLFVLEGEISLSFKEYNNRIIRTNELFFLPSLTQFQGKILSTAKFIIFKNNNVALPCTREAIYRLFKKKQTITFEARGIPIKKEIQWWLDQMIYYRQTGLSCNHIMVIKKQELYFLLKTYYTDKEIIELFYLSLNKNLTFREAVYQNYMQVKTVEELATLLGYGIKTFRKLFKENFSETPSKWIQKQILFQIKGMILEKDISFKQIMFEYKFTSSSHFYHFCHKHFGATPTQIRNGEVSITSRYIQE